MDENKKDKPIGLGSTRQDIIDVSEIAKRDKYSHFLVKKTEKILKAMYLITNFFDTREPLKWGLREVSNNVLNKIVNLSYSSLGDREKNVLDFIAESMKLGSMLETAGIAGLISTTNFNILKQELEHVIRFVESKHETYYMTATSFVLDKDFFDASIKESGANTIKDIYKTSNNKDVLYKDAKPKSVGNISPDRTSKIVELAEKLDWFGVKDIGAILKDVSEKTIQRDLINMVLKGVLEKSGERRWSRYKLATK